MYLDLFIRSKWFNATNLEGGEEPELVGLVPLVPPLNLVAPLDADTSAPAEQPL